VPNTAVLIVTRASTTAIPVASADPDETYLQVSTCGTDTTPFITSTGTTKEVFNLMLKECDSNKFAPLRKIVQQVYYISSCNNCTGANVDTTPTLKVTEWQKGAMTTPVAVAEGIENLQADFGIDMDGSGLPACYVSNPSDTSPPQSEVGPAVCPPVTPPYVWTDANANWSNVMAVRVHVLARQTVATPGWNDTRTYNLGLGRGDVGPFGDQFKRGVYSSVVRLYNASGQREQPPP
jgi:type IV pilus assembly protein PilW